LSSEETYFKPGRPKTGGRVKGTRNRIATKIYEDFLADYEQFGAEAWRITRAEDPVKYLQLGISLLPKELEITDSRLKDIPDDELDSLIEIAKRRIPSRISGDAGSGEDAPLN
jgi:hypothetical protein